MLVSGCRRELATRAGLESATCGRHKDRSGRRVLILESVRARLPAAAGDTAGTATERGLRTFRLPSLKPVAIKNQTGEPRACG